MASFIPSTPSANSSRSDQPIKIISPQYKPTLNSINPFYLSSAPIQQNLKNSISTGYSQENFNKSQFKDAGSVSNERAQPITAKELTEIKGLGSDGVRNVGAPKVIALARNLEQNTLKNFINESAISTTEGERSLAADGADRPFRKISAQDLESIHQLGTEGIKAVGGLKGIAKTRGFSFFYLKKLIYPNGLLTTSGRWMMSSAHQVRRRKEISVEHLRELQRLGEEGSISRAKLIEFADKHEYTLRKLQDMVSSTGKLTQLGQCVLTRDKLKGQLKVKITAQNLREVQKMGKEGIKARGGLQATALERRFPPYSFCNLITEDGLLKKKGETLVALEESGVQGFSPTAQQLIEIAQLGTDGIRKSGGLKGIAKQYQIHLFTLKKEITKEGILTPEGLIRINGVVKAEPDDGVVYQHTPHKTNNNSLILQHPEDPSQSRLSVEGPIDQIKVTNWGDLSEVFCTLNAHEAKVIKQKITSEIREWLHSEGDHQRRYENMIYVSRPLDDDEGERGDAVFAKRKVSAFEVLGVYSGRLILNEEEERQEVRKYGKIVYDYNFETRSKHRLVSAFSGGNDMSLVNSATYFETTPQTLDRVNVSAIRAGGNIIFYIAKKDIERDQELLINYGKSVSYQRKLNDAELRKAELTALIKQEPIDQ